MDTNQMYDVLDATFKTLYDHIGDGLHFEKQVLRPNKIKLKPEEADKVWDVLMATGLADSIIGFGNEGKVEITPAGIQMMTRYGSYKNFLAAQQIGSQRQPQQLTIQLVNPEKEQSDEVPEKPAAKPAKRRKPAAPKKKAKPSK